MATIHDVAALAGVSVSSVSNVLNQRTEKLSAETFSRVEAAIQELNYRPNRIDRQLKTGHTPMLGLLVPSTANQMYGQIALQIEATAQTLFGYRLLLGNTHRDKLQEARMFEDLLSFGVRSVIVVSSMDDERHLDEAVASGLAVVSYDRSTIAGVDSQVDHVSPDNYMAGYIAADHLIAHGHQRLAFLVPSGKTVSRGNKMLAIGLLSGLHQAGLRVPEDISVVGMDGLSIAAFSNPSLTSVAMPLTEMAYAMVRRAVERSRQTDLHPANLIFQPTLVARHSVTTPARDKNA